MARQKEIAFRPPMASSVRRYQPHTRAQIRRTAAPHSSYSPRQHHRPERHEGVRSKSVQRCQTAVYFGKIGAPWHSAAARIVGALERDLAGLKNPGRVFVVFVSLFSVSSRRGCGWQRSPATLLLHKLAYLRKNKRRTSGLRRLHTPTAGRLAPSSPRLDSSLVSGHGEAHRQKREARAGHGEAWIFLAIRADKRGRSKIGHTCFRRVGHLSPRKVLAESQQAWNRQND
jgi:hypothetical protein